MSRLAELLDTRRDAIRKYLYVGYAKWGNLINRIAEQEMRPVYDFADEQVWTFLVGCGYAMAREEGIRILTRALTGSDQTPSASKLWFEVLPVPPRRGEGNTHIDLALGTIANRDKTKSGIELDNIEPSWVCFCEMKWYSDITMSVSHDIYRNQLARVIENALCFQGSGKYAEKVYVTLVTPSVFQNPCAKSRLYQYKFEEYDASPTHLMNDLRAYGLKENQQSNWSYPSNLKQQIDSLSLRWVNYDDLFEQHLPTSDISSELYMFWKRNRC
jgi:hypothetical protein